MVEGNKHIDTGVQHEKEVSVLPESEITYNITRNDLKALPTAELVQLLNRVMKMKNLIAYEVRKRMQI